MKHRLLIALVLATLLLGGLFLPRTAQAGGTTCHIVKAGENLTTIAHQLGVSVEELVELNHLKNPNLIFVGQCLLIPTHAQPPSGCTTTYVVKKGEFLRSIAAKFGVSWQSIAAANDLDNPNLIFPGQHLVIPIKCKPAPTPKPPAPTPKPPAPGPWKVQYWNNQLLSGNPTFVTTANEINFNYDEKGPGHGIPATHFSARFTETTNFTDGTFRFHIMVDDGVRFWIDNVLVIDQWHDSAPVEYTADRDMSTGQHTFQIDYFQDTGGALIKFFFEKTGQPLWKAEFWNNVNLQGTPTVTRFDPAIDFDFGLNSPAPGITADYWSARWTGNFAFVGGKYRFTAIADDGMRIWVDNNLILDQFHLEPPTTYTIDVDISAGTHAVKVEFFDNNGTAVAKVSWVQE